MSSQESANIQNLINKFNGNPNPSNSSHPKQTTECRNSQKCDTDAAGGATEGRTIQRECMTKDDATGSTTFQSETETIDFKSAEMHEAKARELREKAEATLKNNDSEFVQAERAQALARIAAEQANAKTQQALEHQEKGQELLAEAGAKLIEAGAKLQQEAMANQKQVPYNIHQQGEVKQTTCVASTGIEAAAHAREVATFREVEPPKSSTEIETSTFVNEIQATQ